MNKNLKWNPTLLQEDVAGETRQLKEAAGNDLLQYGIGELNQTMLKNELIDEMQLLVYPFGKGECWFDILNNSTFKLLE